MLRRMRYILPLTVVLLFAAGKATAGGGTPLLFDVDAAATITGIELHDSMSSTGVQVTLP